MSQTPTPVCAQFAQFYTSEIQNTTLLFYDVTPPSYDGDSWNCDVIWPGRWSDAWNARRFFIGSGYKGKNPARNKGKSESCSLVGNPVNSATGNKYQVEKDITGDLQNSFQLIRHYNSRSNQQGVFGNKWTTIYDQKIIRTTYTTADTNFISPVATLYREDGNIYTFEDKSGIWEHTTSEYVGKLEELADGWQFTTPDNKVEHYDSTGRLTQISEPNGFTQTMVYDGRTGKLIQVVDSLNQSLTFGYDDQNRINAVTDSANRLFTYTYDVNNNLTSVIKPDTTVKTYHYEDINYPNALTGITDERGLRYANWEYNISNQVTASYHAGNASRVDLNYNIDGTTTVTNSKAVSSTYAFENKLGVMYLSSIAGPGCSSCGNGNTSYEYDPSNSNLLAKTVNNQRTEYGDYTSKGEPGFKIEAAGTPEARTIRYSYDPRFTNKVSQIIEPSVHSPASRITTFEYDTFGNPTRYQIDGFRPDGSPVSRSYQLQYNGPVNQLSQIDGPRTDVNDVTNLFYYPNDPAQGFNRGRLQRVEGPNGLILRDNIQYTATGKVQSETGINGLFTTNTYYPGNDRLETRTQGDYGQLRTTHWSYLPTGEVEAVTLGAGTPEEMILHLTYDDARRLRRITDRLGNYIEFELDTEGNQLSEKVFDNMGFLKKTLNQTFDVYNRLHSTSQANENNGYDFAPDGTLNVHIDGNNVVTEFGYDALKRLTTTNQDPGGSDPSTINTLTQYGYNVHDKLTSVTDPKGSRTDYLYDDLGNMLVQISPDTDVTTFTHDEAGNIKTRTDAKGQVLHYMYDEFNRLLSIDAPGTEEDINLIYDVCPYGLGRLCHAHIGTTSIDYFYNAFGDVEKHQGTVYEYDSVGRIKTMIYASGIVLNYQYNPSGQIRKVTANIEGMDRILVDNVQYQPFGPVESMIYGNGKDMLSQYDTAYRSTQLNTPGVLQLNYPAYDGNGNILAQDELISSNFTNYAYDSLDRLIASNDSLFVQAFSYDKNGNRIQLFDNSILTNYEYSPAGNQLQQAGSVAIVTDPNGNIESDGTNNYTYSSYNLLNTVNGNVSYRYNALGQRISKTVDGVETQYIYDLNGKLISERDASGQITKDYFYLGSQPIAVYSHSQTVAEPVDLVIDNPEASYIGNWRASSKYPGFIGSNYHFIDPGVGTGPVPLFVVDNGDPGTSVVGTWLYSSRYAGYKGSDYAYNAAGTGQNVYTWPIGVDTPGEYRVYANWTSSATRATDASYTITHVNGVDTVTVNQQTNSGSWQLLGSFMLDANSQVSLSDAANGSMVADAIMVAGLTDQINAATWVLPVAAGNYQIYANWSADAGRANDAPYTINHAGGSTPIVVNQRINGASWQLLGEFALGESSSIQLTQSLSGYSVADGIRIVGESQAAGAGELHYIHTDHLGTPRAVTNDTGTVIWRWQSDPFGHAAANDDPDGDGNTNEMNLRFAGQYYDAESGLHYNYFRYYDPKTGRYITSDPIGLMGGLNTYSYVNANPINGIDPWGLFKVCRRPLSFMGNYMSSGSTGTNLGLFHEHGFYEDGSGDNVGFGPDGVLPDNNNSSNYECSNQSYDDSTMRQAELNISANWPGDSYNFITNNCQDYIDALLDEYNRLLTR
ncbi:MAG: DUF6531 domain-containing protein [Gammaproteobacteria bacterium]|nr:DUF6531 domain-containing protein [Gammaproteobacteria bacterium]